MKAKSYREIKDEYTEKRMRAIQIGEERRSEIYAAFPEVEEIDKMMVTLIHGLVGAGDEAYKKLDKIEELTLKRANILASGGYPSDYTNPQYECKKCNDSGYDGVMMCDCLKKRLRIEAIKSSGLGKLAETQDFDNFSLDYYKGENRVAAETNLSFLRDFSENFSQETDLNFFLLGGTGLGKTHLSTAVAKTVINKGYDVVYTTAINMFDDFESKRFSSNFENEHSTDRYFDCDLLIVDDLGCEMSTQFTVSVLYNLINTRLNDAKSTIFNTNLYLEDFQKKYEMRITSRILGSFKPLLFNGEDIRRQKLAKN